MKTASKPVLLQTASRNEKWPLSALKPGEAGIIASLETPHELSVKLIEMGVSPGERVTAIRKAPFGDPMEYEVMNTRLALRASEAEKITITITAITVP